MNTPKLNTADMTTDELFEALPLFIQVGMDFYNFELVKGRKRNIVCYQMNRSSKCLDDIRKGGDTLKEALKTMLDWLIESGYHTLVESE